MSDWVAGLLAIGIGAVFCFRGFLAMRIVIAIWGALVGFTLGASLGGGDSGILATGLSWILAIVLAVVFALIAYLYYAISIAIAMGSIGFTIGASIVVALGISWSWLIVLAGLALGVTLAIVAIAGDLPTMLLVLLSALAGASAITGGIMLLTGALDTEQISRSAAATESLNDDWYWYVIWIGLTIGGIIVQISEAARLTGSMREAWDQT